MGCLAPVVHAAAGERHCACRAGVGPVCHQLIRAHPSASLASEPGALGGPCRSAASTCSPTAAAALENAARGGFSVTRPKAAAKADEWIYVLAGSEAGFGSGLANEPGSNSSANGRGCRTPAWLGSALFSRSCYVNCALFGISTSAVACSSCQRLPRRAHVPMIGRAGFTRLGTTPSVGGGRCPEI
jgi:hypothetical protein